MKSLPSCSKQLKTVDNRATVDDKFTHASPASSWRAARGPDHHTSLSFGQLSTYRQKLHTHIHTRYFMRDNLFHTQHTDAALDSTRSLPGGEAPKHIPSFSLS